MSYASIGKAGFVLSYGTFVGGGGVRLVIEPADSDRFRSRSGD